MSNTTASLIARTIRQMSWAFLVNPSLLQRLLEDVEEELGTNPGRELAEVYRALAEWHAQQDETILADLAEE